MVNGTESKIGQPAVRAAEARGSERRFNRPCFRLRWCLAACLGGAPRSIRADVVKAKQGTGVRLTDEQRLDWLRLIRSENVGPRGIMAQTPPALL